MMRWRSSPTSESQQVQSPDDYDEPDSSSSVPVNSNSSANLGSSSSSGSNSKLGASSAGNESSDLPPSAEGGLLDTEAATSEALAAEVSAGYNSNNNNNKSQSGGSQSHSQSSQAISPAASKLGPADGRDNDEEDDDDEEDDGEEDDDDDDDDDDDEAADDGGIDHSQPPDDDDGSETDSPPWKPQTTQSMCEFTHTIVNYSHKRESGCKKAEYSATTVDEFGNRWRLIIYVNGNGRASNHHLSLFLQVCTSRVVDSGTKSTNGMCLCMLLYSDFYELPTLI